MKSMGTLPPMSTRPRLYPKHTKSIPRPGSGQNPALHNVWHSLCLASADGELAPLCNIRLERVGKEEAFIVPSAVALVYFLSQVLSGYNYKVNLCRDLTRSGQSPLMGKCALLSQEKYYGGNMLPSYNKSS